MEERSSIGVLYALGLAGALGLEAELIPAARAALYRYVVAPPAHERDFEFKGAAFLVLARVEGHEPFLWGQG